MAYASHLPWYRRTPRGWQHFQSIPLARLSLLFLAVFILFSSFGFFNDLMKGARAPYSAVIANAVFSGLISCSWLFVTTRLAMYWVLGLIVVQFSTGSILNSIDESVGRAFPAAPATAAAGVHFAAISMLVVIILSYLCFVTFIRREGRESFRLHNELELAHGIQKTLVPPVSLATAQFEIYGISQPSEQVGGDLVDALCLPGGDAVVYIADIAGHGLQAGILMGMLKTATRTGLLDAGERSPENTLPDLLQQLNTVLPEVKEPQMYATFTGMRLCNDGTIHYALAASPPLLHWHAGPEPSMSQLEESQFPLGLLPVERFDGSLISTERGDLIVVATDGILEVSNRDGEEFGVERLKSVIAQNPHAALPELSQKILENVRSFGKQLDDQTILLVRRL